MGIACELRFQFRKWVYNSIFADCVLALNLLGGMQGIRKVVALIH